MRCHRLLLLLGGLLIVWAQGQLTPVGTVAVTSANPIGVQQMAYDPTSQALYLAISLGNTIMRVSTMSSVALTPSSAAPWGFVVLVGGNGLLGPPGPTEMNPTTATFYSPTGIIGWPRYTIEPSAATEWVGLWVADCSNNAIRFIHFFRGNNVTLVAGSIMGLSGAQDGIGTAALLYMPRNLAWGRFLRNEAVNEERTGQARTSVVYWSDDYNHCLRQGIPFLDNYFLEDGPVPADALQAMVLNVSTFAGLCGSNVGYAIGLVVPWRPMFNHPWGIALAGLPSSAVLFVGETDNPRLSMITPMYPVSARALTDVWSNRYLFGVTIAQVRFGDAVPSNADALVVVVGIDVIASIAGYRQYANISVTLTVNTSKNANGSTIENVAQSAGSPTVSDLATTGMAYPYNVKFVRYAPNSSYCRTLVVFGGYNNGPNDVLKFYCCLGAEYSEPIDVSSGGDGKRWTATSTQTTITTTMLATNLSSSLSQTVSESCTSPTNSQQLTMQSDSRTKRPSATFSHVRVRRLSERSHLSATWMRSSTRVAAQRGRNATFGGTTFPISSRSEVATNPAAASAATAVVVSTVAPSAASKAAVAGRAAMVFWCSRGSSQASVNDPQQFLNFGLSLGAGDSAVVRGAFVLTTWLRVAAVIVFIVVAARSRTTS